ncbi:MAG: hypothetical protein WCJ58_00865 [bacterium]
MTKQLEITPEIHQAWIDVEKQMANFDKNDHAAVTSHNHIGNAIYGENLDRAKTFICENSFGKIEIQDLDHLEVL